MTKHVMITGGMGFIGHHLAKLYADEGHRVTIVDNLSVHINIPKLTKFRMEYLDSKKVFFIHHSCNMSFTIGKQLKFGWPDSIIHLASHANQAAVDTDQYGAINSMLGNVFNTMEMAKNFNSKYIFVSSSMAYGNFTQNPQPESALLSPVNLYGLLKKQGEELVHQLDGQSVIVRPSAVYGPGDNQKRVLGKWINAALNNEVIIVNDPGSLLDFTYVKDTAMGIMLAEEHGHIGKTYNITRGQARSLSEAAFLIKYMLASQSQIEYKKSKSTNTPQRGALDISAAQDDLGYAPKFDLTDGLEEYINWMRKYRHIYE